jgi:hypothetical protein
VGQVSFKKQKQGEKPKEKKHSSITKFAPILFHLINSSLQRAFPAEKNNKPRKREKKKRKVATTLCCIEMIKMHKLHQRCCPWQQIKRLCPRSQ